MILDSVLTQNSFLALGEPHVVDTLQYLIGFVFVMAVLFLLWGMTALIGRIGIASARSSRTPAEPATASSGESVAPAEISPQTLAAIAAAVHCSLDQPVRLVAIRPTSPDWSAEGRRQIFASRRVR